MNFNLKLYDLSNLPTETAETWTEKFLKKVFHGKMNERQNEEVVVVVNVETDAFINRTIERTNDYVFFSGNHRKLS